MAQSLQGGILLKMLLEGNLLLLIIPIIFKLTMSKVLFLFVLFLTLKVQTQVLSPISKCLGTCSNCDLLNLVDCRSPNPCQWGFYDPSLNNTCLQTPSTKTIFQQLGQRINRSQPFISQGWSSTSKQSTCQYQSSEGKQIIDVLGLFSGVQMLEKTFSIGSNIQLLEISFNMLHDQWLPFNDFLIVDLSSNNQNLATLQISYETRVQVDSQVTQITCSGKRVLNNKYSIKIINDANLQNSLTLIFTSFLFSSSWAISNLKIVEGCTGYSMFDPNTQKCNLCDQDSFVVKDGDSQWCQKCPNLCMTCSSANTCLTCVTGASVGSDGLCSFGDKFKSQLVPLGQQSNICDNTPILLGSSDQPLQLESLKNDNNLLYDEVQIGFNIYYQPSEWKQTDRVIVKLNQIEIIQLTSSELSNQATNLCSSFNTPVARMEIFSDKIVHNDNVVGVSFEVVGSAIIGISNVRVKSIKKDPPTPEPVVEPQTPTQPSQPQQPIQPAQPQQPAQPAQPTQPTPSLPANNTEPVSNQTTPPNNTIPDNTTTSPNPLPSNNTNNDSNPEKPPQNQTSQPIQPQPQPQTSSQQQIDFLPALSDKKSGIQVFITGQNSNSQNYYTAQIDKLTPDQYAIDSYYIQDGKLNMFVAVQQSFKNGKVSVYRNSLNARLLQNNAPVLIGSFPVERFDSIDQSQVNSIENFSIFFSIAAWAGIFLMIFSVLSGYGIVVEQYILTLQILFLHVYIAADYIPVTFRDTIGGLNLIENLNFFMPSHSETIEHQWMGNVIQNGPVRFYMYNTDINFLRQFYPIIIINIVYALWFGIIFVARKKINKDLIEEQKGIVHKFLDNLAGRPVNYADQIWRYQFLATLWACFVQFYNFTYPDNSGRSQALNAIICIFSFICCLAWPAFTSFHTLKEYYECQYSQFLYNFEDIFYLKIPQYQLPSTHHRLGYPLLRAGKIFVLVLAVCYFGNIASLTLITMVLLHVVELIYLKMQGIYNNKKAFLMKFAQNSLFILIDVILLGLLNFSSLAISQSYIYIGFILSGIATLLVLNGWIRIGYYAHSKYKKAVDQNEEWMIEDKQIKKPKTQRVV